MSDNAPTSGWLQAAASCDLTIQLDDNTPLFFQHIPAGSFRMGARGFAEHEEPIHTVHITEPFYLSTFPVTQAQWQAVVRRQAVSGLDECPSEFEGDFHPVEQVSWDDAVAWCRCVRDGDLLQDLPNRAGIRVVVRDFGLPTEAQWEYACRAGTDTEYYTGDGAGALAEAGWYSANSGGSTSAVGGKARNNWGLYDMHGNVDEWCRDVWDPDTYRKRRNGVCDPDASAHDVSPKIAADQVIRGGSWPFSAWYCRAADRDGFEPNERAGFRGFRVCLFPGSESAR